jgi:PAS domain S-box-containing protein
VDQGFRQAGRMPLQGSLAVVWLKSNKIQGAHRRRTPYFGGGRDAMQGTEFLKYEKYLKLLLDHSPEILLILDRDCRLVFCSQAFLSLTGIPALDAISGKHVGELWFGDESAAAEATAAIAEATVQRVEKAKAELNPFTTDVRVDFSHQGEYREFTIKTVPMLDDSGGFDGVLVQYYDTTDLRSAEASQASLMLDAAPLAVSFWDDQGNMLDCNREALRMFGLKEKSDYTEHFFDLNPEFQPDGEPTHEKAMKLIEETLKTGYRRFEWMYQTITGEPLPVETTLIRVPWGDEYRITAYSRDLREIKAKEKIAREAEEYNKLMVEALPLGCIVFDENLETVICNVEALRLYGFTSQAEFDEKFIQFAPEYQPNGMRSIEMIKQTMGDAFKTGKAHFEWKQHHVDGRLLSFEVILVRVPGRDKPLIVAYGRDMTEIKAQEKIAREAEEQIWEQNLRLEEQNTRLVELKKTAEDASKAKSSFLATMSHEMRTPLNAIIGLSELGLGSGELTGNAYSSMEKIYVSGMTLLGIINDILDISKIESGKFILIPADYETPSSINDTIIQNMIRIGSKPIQFKLTVDKTFPFKLSGDELRVKQIFNNLLSNAFKYTEKGTVDWRLSSEADGDSVWIVSSIRDTGLGIKQEDIPKLFTDYNQVDVKNRRRIEGTGLGLSITKKLVELMDGTITAESEYGKGSVFSLRIRQGYVNEAVIGEEIARSLSNFNYTAERRSRNGKLVRSWLPYANVLVVDDVPMNLDVAKGMLKPYGITVDCVDGGQKAIDLIREEKTKYSAVFMDHMMPGMDGFEAVRIIREEIGTEYAKSIPIIALTANAIIGNEDLFLKNGFQAFLSKPIDIIQLDMIVNRHVRNKDLERELGLTGRKPESERSGAVVPDKKPDKPSNGWQPSEEGQPSKRKQPGIMAGRSMAGIDFNSGLKRFDDNEETYLKILSSYFAQIQTVAEKMRNCTPVPDGPPETLKDYRIMVHSLKSTSYTIGARHIGGTAEELEKAALAGDTVYINAHSGHLVDLLEKLIPVLKNFLDEIQSAKQKPLCEAPDPALLSRLLTASADYDMEQMDTVMAQLEQYRYKSQPDLINWLRKEFDKSELESIREHLESLNIRNNS